jgi:hypothetical protein
MMSASKKAASGSPLTAIEVASSMQICGIRGGEYTKTCKDSRATPVIDDDRWNLPTEGFKNETAVAMQMRTLGMKTRPKVACCVERYDKAKDMANNAATMSIEN